MRFLIIFIVFVSMSAMTQTPNINSMNAPNSNLSQGLDLSFSGYLPLGGFAEIETEDTSCSYVKLAAIFFIALQKMTNHFAYYFNAQKQHLSIWLPPPLF